MQDFKISNSICGSEFGIRNVLPCLPEHEIVLDFGAGGDVALVAVEEVVLLRQQHRLQDGLVVLLVELAVKLLLDVVVDDVVDDVGGGRDVGVGPGLGAGALGLSLRSLVPHPATIDCRCHSCPTKHSNQQRGMHVKAILFLRKISSISK